MLMHRRRWLRYNNSVFEDVTSYTPPRTHTHAYARRARICAFRGLFIWQISLRGVSTFITRYPLGLCPTIYIYSAASGRRTGVSYRWPINAGVEARYIRVYLRARRDRFRECPRGTAPEFFSAPFSIRFSRSARYSPTGSRAKTLYYVNCIKRETLTSNDYQLMLMWSYA